MTAFNDIRWDSAARTHVGKVRKLNEDAYLARPASGMWSVADGMGGHDAGDFASAAVVTALEALEPEATLVSLSTQVSKTLETVNTWLFDEARERKARIIGTTIVTFLAAGREAAVIWAGDSRAYRLRKGQLAQLTRDHSRIQTLIDQGQVTAEDAERHPDANVITRAIGVTDTLELDSRRLDVRDGDCYLICSDGLYRYVSDEELTALLGLGDAEYACEALLERALSRAARDNITAIVMRAELDDTTLRTQVNPNPGAGAEGEDNDPTVLDPDPQ